MWQARSRGMDLPFRVQVLKQKKNGRSTGRNYMGGKNLFSLGKLSPGNPVDHLVRERFDSGLEETNEFAVLINDIFLEVP